MSGAAGIVWLASYPKSGNTWFRVFLANLAVGEHGPADINDLDERGGIASGRLEFDAATLLDSRLLSHEDIDGIRPAFHDHLAAHADAQRWVKVHDAYTSSSCGEPLLGRAGHAAIYIVRDPRDVAISLSHHNNVGIDGAIEMMNSADTALSKARDGTGIQLRQRLLDWSGHVSSWIDQPNVPVHLVRYEDLCADPVLQFGRALAFAGRAATRAEIERAVRHADFAELQRQEAQHGFAERVSRDAPFFRTGRAGGWRSKLSAAQLARIEDAHGPMMQRLEYSLAADAHARGPLK